jgi:3-dehydroquinate synthase
MTRIIQRISVPFEYRVCFSEQVFALANTDLVDALSSREPHRRHRVLAVVDSEVAAAWPSLLADVARYAEHHANRMQLVSAPIIVTGGEGCKNDASLLDSLYATFRALGMDRHSYVVIVGGGAVLDAVGYAAASCHRGLRVVRVPTTVLGQADSGVGVKNGVNLLGSKNFVGTFAPPWAVLNDASFLRTLARRDRIAGMAEAVKVALIRDPVFYAWIHAHADALAGGDSAALAYLCRRSAELHLAHIRDGGDPFELGSARPLDFGHWSAHKLESMTQHRLRHGEAVAIGMALDARYAAAAGMLAPADARDIQGLLVRLGFRLWDDALAITGANGMPAVLAGLDEFREHLGGELTVTLLEGIGRGVEVHAMDPLLIVDALDELARDDAARAAA